MKKYFVAFLVCIFCCSTVVLGAETNQNGHKHCDKPNNHIRHSQGCHNNCSNSKVLTYVENFEETSPFVSCKEHSLVTYTQILHYSDGSTDSNYRYRILGNDGVIIADNLYRAKHFVNSKGKHYFLIKSPEYKNYVIMDSKGNVAHTKGYKKYQILGKDNILVKQDKKYGIVDFENNIVLDIKYKSIEDYDTILLTKYNGYYGLTDKTGKVVLNNVYDKITKYGNVFVLKYQNKFGIADLNGKILYTPSFDSIKHDGDYLKVKINDKFGIIDTNGQLVAEAEYKKVRIERNLPQVYENKVWKQI